nr:spheroidene monooxygenase [Palleronia sp. THAF1]
MALARLDFMRDRDCSFWKLCGSGTGQGFTPLPNTAVWAILAVWPDEATARDRLTQAPIYRRWSARAEETCSLLLHPISARGTWSGSTPFKPQDAMPGPVAALTRATIRPRHMRRFWAAEPDISARIGTDPNVAFKIGIGELPWLHQVTFSVWPDADSMAAFARTNGPHAEAIRAVRDGDWFAEELYARFHVADTLGTWNGAPPLDKLPEAA